MESTPITPKLIRETIKDGFEPDEPAETILKILRENDGKRVDKLLLRKIRDATKDESIRLEKDYGMTHLIWGKEQHLMLLAYDEKNVVVNSSWVYKQNPAFFDARVRRNQLREAVLHRTALIGELSEAANRYIEARKRLINVLGAEYFGPDVYSIRDLIKARVGDRSYILGGRVEWFSTFVA